MTARHATKTAAAAVSAADKKRRAPQKGFKALPPEETLTAEEYIARIRKAQDGIHEDCLYKPLPPSAEIIDEFGRSSFSPDYYELVFNYCLLGATNKEIAVFLGIPHHTIDMWSNRDRIFRSAIDAGRAQADARVSTSLYRRATGYSHKAVKIFYDAKEDHVETVEYIQHYPPETSAAIFWLKNRQSDRWKDKVTNEHSGPDGRPIEVENVRTTLAERIARLADANAAGRSDPVIDTRGVDGDQPRADGEGAE